MGKIIYILYNLFFVNLLLFIVRILSPFNKKLKMRNEEIKKCQKECLEKLKKKRGEKRILFHCSSLGEWEQAAPVVEIIKKNSPQVSIVVSFFSISGYNHVKNNPYVSGKVFLPYDSFKKASQFFNALKPDLWIISAYDIWPNHIMAAKRLNIPIVIISATLAKTSARNKGLLKSLNKYIFKNIHAIYSRSSQDTKRFLSIYPFPEKIMTYGDTRADRVYEKSIYIRKEPDIPVFKGKTESGLVFIAGSTWPADEKIILPGIIKLLQKFDSLKAIIVPHEIKDDHIKEIEKLFRKANIETERYTKFRENEGTTSRVAIIDAIGVLAKLYKNTDVAYIGGSFGKGVHNVLEPAVFGMPVLFGPKHHNSQEALSLKDLGVTFSIRRTSDFTGKMEQIIEDADYREKCSLKALGYIRNNLGASGKIYQHLMSRYDFLE